jgi:hypothetical protein
VRRAPGDDGGSGPTVAECPLIRAVSRIPVSRAEPVSDKSWFC